MVGKPVNPKCGLRVECVGNRHDNKEYCTGVRSCKLLVLFIRYSCVLRKNDSPQKMPLPSYFLSSITK